MKSSLRFEEFFSLQLVKIILCSMVQAGAVLENIIPYSPVHYAIIQDSTTQYNTVQPITVKLEINF